MDLYEQYWANYRPANARGAGHIPGYILAPHVLTAATGGQDVSTTGTTPIVPGLAVTAGTQGVAFTALDAAWSNIITNLVLRNLVENLRKDAVFAQSGSQALRATHVAGTNAFVFTAFGDLPPAVDLLEGVPPQSIRMSWTNQTFTGKQRGQVVAITDLAEIFSPFDLYSQAAEKLAWNAVEAIEDSIYATISAAGASLAITPTAGYALGIVDMVTKMRRAEIPTYADGTYHAYASPETIAKVMVEAGALGWTEAQKYANPDALLNGEVGKFRGMRFIETTRLPGTPDTLIAHGPEAWAQGDYQTIRPYRVTGADHADPLEQRALFGWKGMFGHTAIKMAAAVDGAPATNTLLQRIAKGTLTPAA